MRMKEWEGEDKRGYVEPLHSSLSVFGGFAGPQPSNGSYDKNQGGMVCKLLVRQEVGKGTSW